MIKHQHTSAYCRFFPLILFVAAPHIANALEEHSSLSGIEEILVSARRVEESSQSVPVTMHAFDSESMRENSFIMIKDLMYTVPGIYMGGAGPQENAIYSVRGQGRPVAGAGQPGVLTYFADVPLSTWASSVPAYDISSLQVLKGPQGTLFGRNTTGGAVLTYPNKPNYEFGGYLNTNFGNYNLNTYEAVVNVPLVDETLALRVATYFDRRDGLVENIGTGDDLEDLHSDNARISLLWEPTESMSNEFIYDYRRARQAGTAPRLLETTVAVGFFGPSLEALSNQSVERQQQLGPWKVDYGDFKSNGSDIDIEGFFNCTNIELGPVTLTNIFGYREVEWINTINTDGMAGEVGFISANNFYTDKQLSNEIQLKGSIFNDKVDWLLGGFYLESEPTGPFGSDLDFFFSHAGRFSYSLNEQESRAIFGNAAIDLSAWLPGLSLNLGYRYTWDDYATCAGAGEAQAPYNIGLNSCPNSPDLIQTTVADLTTDSSSDTWIIGLDYQVNDELFLYASSRKGYRAGGINTPGFGAGLQSVQFFDPDEVIDIEVGMRSDWNVQDVRGRLNLSVFRAETKDAQVVVNGIRTLPTCNPANPVQPASPDGDCDPNNDPNLTVILANLGDTVVSGGEMELIILPTDNLSLGITATLLDQKTDSYNPDPAIAIYAAGSNEIPMNYQPELSYTANIRYRFPVDESIGEMVFNLDYFWSDSLEFVDYVTDDYALINLRFDWNSIASSPWDIGAFVRNLADEDAVIGSSLSTRTLPVRSGIYNEPRVYGLNIRYRFGSHAM